MAVINIYKQYFEADLEFNGVKRKAALVLLISDSQEGKIKYEAAVTFFPHENETDFSITYDACFSEILYQGQGRRSKKREQELLKILREKIDLSASKAKGKVFWDKPLSKEQSE